MYHWINNSRMEYGVGHSRWLGPKRPLHYGVGAKQSVKGLNRHILLDFSLLRALLVSKHRRPAVSHRQVDSRAS